MTNSPRTIPPKCLGFYLQGREDGLKVKRKDVASQARALYFGPRFPSDTSKDTSKSATEATPTIRDLVNQACVDVAKERLGTTRKRRRWASDHASEISAAGVTDDVACDAYLMGCADEAALGIEGFVVEAIFADYDDDDDDEPDGDPDDDDDDDEEEGDDDED